MSKKKKLSHFPAELQKNLSSIENRLKKPVDQKTFLQLFQKLKKAQDQCSFIKSNYTTSSFHFLSNQEERICTLFGKVINTHVDSEVELILSKAKNLKKEEKDKALLLQKEIEAFRKKHRPSRENLNKIFQAEKAIKHITNPNPSIPTNPEETPIPEEVENLLQLASFVYNKNKTERNKIYLTLSPEAKNHFNKHLISLKTKAFEKEESTIQALFASAFELAGIPVSHYPSSKEIQEFFLETQNILGD